MKLVSRKRSNKHARTRTRTRTETDGSQDSAAGSWGRAQIRIASVISGWDRPGLVYLINSSLLSAGPAGPTPEPREPRRRHRPEGLAAQRPTEGASQEGCFSFRGGPAGRGSRPDQIRSRCRRGGRGVGGHTHSPSTPQTRAHTLSRPYSHSAHMHHTRHTIPHSTVDNHSRAPSREEVAVAPSFKHSVLSQRILGGTTE